MWERTSIMLLSLVLWSCSSDVKNDILKDEFKVWASMTEIEVGKEMNLKVEGSANEKIDKVSWSMGNVDVIEGKEVRYIYSKPGKYNIVATITLKNGEEHKQALEVSAFYNKVDENVRRSLKRRIKEDKVIVCSHRGFGKFAAENSMDAFNLSIEKGVEMIEIDVRMSKDGRLVLMHDATIDRTTNGKGSISQLSYDELSLFNLYNGSQLTIAKIPLLEDVLNAVRGKVYIDVDVKSTHIRETYELIKLYGMQDQVLFTVYDLQANTQLKKIDENLLIMPIIYEMKDLDDYVSINNPLHVAQFNSKGFTNEIVGKAIELNIEVFKNTYVNTSKTPTSDAYKEVKEFISKKGKIIQTDHPEELFNYFENIN